MALADAYMDNGMFDSAIVHYKSSLTDMFSNDFYVLSRLQEAYFLLGKIDESLAYAERIKDDKSFVKSASNFLYAKTLDQKAAFDVAEQELRRFDAPYNYYPERLELARFLIRRDKKGDAKKVLQEIADESENMSKQSMRANKLPIKLAKEELAHLI